MKKQNLIYLSLVLLLAFLISSCAKEVITTTETETQFPPAGEVITTTVQGVILDDDGPVQNAEVRLESGALLVSSLTDEYGNFLFKDVSNLGNSAYLRVVKDGKFDAFRRLAVFKDRYSYTQIKMVEKTTLSEVNNSEGATLNHASGAKISLPANGVVDENGQLISGNYKIAMTWIDPSGEDLAQRMVGDLSGIDTEGNLQALGSFGMLQVELNADNGQALNLKEGSFANLEFPVPASMVNNAPATIPLWSFDEENGYWVEEGQANLVDNYYIGEVGHFSTWNVDTKDDPVDISGQFVIDNYGRPLPPSYFEVALCLPNGTSVGGWLCDDGSFTFLNTPQGETFTLKLIDYCGETVYSEVIGPFNEETFDLGVIEVMSSTVLSVQAISGNAINCDLAAVTDGFVQVQYQDLFQIHPLNDDGSFDFLVTTCEDFEVLFQVIDNATIYGSDWVSVSNIDGVYDFNDVIVCTELENYIHFVIEGHVNLLKTENLAFQEFWNETDTAVVLSHFMEVPSFELLRITWDKSALVGSPTPGITVDASNTAFIINNSNFALSAPAENVETLLEIAFESFDENKAKGSFNGVINIQGIDVPIYGSFNVNN